MNTVETTQLGQPDQISAASEPLMRVSNLSKFYGDIVGCENVTFELNPGEVLGIVGESGSGKSTCSIAHPHDWNRRKVPSNITQERGAHRHL